MKTFNNRPMTFYESLHWCGCASCQADIKERVAIGPALKPDLVAYIKATYPKTGDLLDA